MNGVFVLLLVELVFLFFLSQFLTRSLSQLLYRLTKNQTATIRLLAVLFLPGIVVHELAHMLVASMLFVSVGDIEFVPQVTKHGVKLGSVAIAKTDPIRRMLIGFAPVMTGVVIIFGILYAVVQKEVVTSSIVSFYLIFVVSNTMFSSQKDMEGTVEALVVIVLLVFLLYLLGVQVDISFLQNFFSDSNEFLRNAVILLSLPIAIDIGILGITKLLRS